MLIETLEAADLHTQRHVDLQKHFARFAYENPILICILREKYTSPAAPVMSGTLPTFMQTNALNSFCLNLTLKEEFGVYIA